MSNRHGDEPQGAAAMRRRALLQLGSATAGLLLVGDKLVGCSQDGATAPFRKGQREATAAPAAREGGRGALARVSNIDKLSPLGPPDDNGVRVPAGFVARLVARTGQVPVAGSNYRWHSAPDGGATFSMPDGGWVYVSNAEMGRGQGGVGALRFSARGELMAAYPILAGSAFNCAGGPTPWKTWLSCEEYPGGKVWECDPTGANKAVLRPALGTFAHEAVAVDPLANKLYLTEDVPDGRLYRYTPRQLTKQGRPDLSGGTLEVMRVMTGQVGQVQWLPLPDPTAASIPTRLQVPTSTPFYGGEGIWYHNHVVYFTTKGDNRVWALHVRENSLSIIYDAQRTKAAILHGVDNVTVTTAGDVVVAEDGGDLEIVALTPGGKQVPLVQLVGHTFSEITGPAFADNHQRLYFSSQRGMAGFPGGGMTFEVTGPFFV